MDELFIYELQLPAKVKALTVPDENGDYTIIINECLSPSAKREALMHERIHIEHDHFYKELPVAIEENDAAEHYTAAKKFLHKVRIE